MLDYLALLCLLLLTIGHGILIRGCFDMKGILPGEMQNITASFESVNEVLTECLDCLDAIATGESTATGPPPAQGLQEVLLNSFITRMAMGRSDGEETTAKTGRPVHEGELEPQKE
uniref:Uncharacterized protein n=1 Tax=uncultured marine group II/III euryarchaeote KM3_16_D12 TaxID=1457926 RepID=A0A075GQG6_9EURY|nr:hypothetical protein [uncultured marine group II/III euryarchaeote KM3_16_D12]